MKRLIGAAVAAATLSILATAAIAKVSTLTGSFTGDADSSISLDVKINKKGKPKQITGGAFAKLDLRCGDGSLALAEGTLPKMTLEKSGSKYSFEAASAPVFELTGTVDKKGKNAKGKFSLRIDEGEHPPCVATDVPFKAN